MTSRYIWTLAAAWVAAVILLGPFAIEALDRARINITLPGLPVTVSEILVIACLAVIGPLVALRLQQKRETQ